MRKVNLNMKEKKKYEEIKRLVELGDNGNKKRVAVKLGCTVRTVNRLIHIYESQGKEGFCHKNKGRTPSIAYSDELKEKIINLYVNEYSDANIKHFTEIIEEDMDIQISDETIRLWLIDKRILSPKSHRITKKRIKQLCRAELKAVSSKKEQNELKTKIEEVDSKSAHPRRERCKFFGEMIQMDASELEWIPDSKWHLHLAVDDATGQVVGAYFDYQETLNGYYHVLYQILTDYGIPAMFYTDRRTVFEYKRKNRGFDNEDTFTQFSYACKKLGIEIKTTSVAQAKGRIERLNQSFQSRLPIELRRAKVKTIEEANIFLKSYLKKYNKAFALQLNTTKSVFEKKPSIKDINNYLSVLSVRTIDHGHTIRFKNKIYMPANKAGKTYSLQEGMTVIMIETFDNKLMINIFDDLYYAKEIKRNSSTSREFDWEEIDDTPDYGWILPRKTSWRTQDFLGYLGKQKHRSKQIES